MNRTFSIALAGIITLAVIAGCSKGYESQRSVGGLNVMLTAERYPLVKADNTLGVKVADPSGKTVTDAKVEARFYMPQMPGMAAIESTTQAALSGDKYVFTANPAMEGGWKVDVTVMQQGKPVTATFNVDAR